MSLNRLRTAFPKMGDGFFSLLAERARANGFTDERLRDAVNHVLDNMRYKELTVADIISYDRTAPLYTYHEVCSLVTRGQATFDDFERVEVGGRVFRVRKADIARTGR